MKGSIALHWRRIPERYRLEGTYCETCDLYYFPARRICSKCRRKGRIVPYTFSGKGKIYSLTEIHSPPEGLEDQIPYVLAIVELEERARCTAQIVDVKKEDIKIGDEVEMVFRIVQREDPEGLISYGFKFRKLH